MSDGKSNGDRVSLPDGSKGTVIEYRNGTVTPSGFEPLPDSPTIVLPDGATQPHQTVTVPNHTLK